MAVVTLFAVVLALSGAAQAACSLEGVWKGTWQSRSHSGPVELSVDTKWGIPYVALQSSTRDGERLPPQYYLRKDAANAVAFRSVAGPYSLQKSGCQLSGVQRHPEGRVQISLRQTGSSTSKHRLPQLMPSAAALDYLSGETYRGSFQWGQMAGRSTVAFALTSQCVTAQVTNVYSKTERREATCVSNPRGWLRFAYRAGGKNGVALIAVSASGRDMYMITHNGEGVLFRTLRRQ